jgi:hypothetical protein
LASCEYLMCQPSFVSVRYIPIATSPKPDNLSETVGPAPRRGRPDLHRFASVDRLTHLAHVRGTYRAKQLYPILEEILLPHLLQLDHLRSISAHDEPYRWE